VVSKNDVHSNVKTVWIFEAHPILNPTQGGISANKVQGIT
jgi:hypothetical protein